MDNRNIVDKVGKMIMVIWRWLLLLGYLAICGLLIYSISHCINIFLYENINLQTLVLLLVVMVIIPIGVFIFLFHKKEKKVLFGIQLGAQILIIPYLVYMVGLAVVLPMTLFQSETTDIDNYYIFDEGVAEHIEQSGMDIMPQILSENITEIEYAYSYTIPFDSVVNINASWRYISEEDYEQVKNEMLGREVAETYEENGYIVSRLRQKLNGSKENKAEFGYDDENYSVILSDCGRVVKAYEEIAV